MKGTLKIFILLFAVALLGTSCKKVFNKDERSSATGWKYNDPEWGGFEVPDFEEQATGPGLVLIPGGTFKMGVTDEDVTYEWNNVPRRVTVTSFYMDQTEVANIHYREYLYDMERWYRASTPEAYYDALPDTLVWREELAYNEPLVETYLRYPSYNDYPVVGVNWEQSVDYAKWRTDKVNQMILIERGILNPDPEAKGSKVFSTKGYLSGNYQGNVRKNLEDKSTGAERQVEFSDGILLPEYRLPTEAEWEYAALALHGNMQTEKDELITDARIFPWDSYTARYQRRDRHQGKMLVNFKRGKGDYMGVSVRLNDNAAVPAPVFTGYANDFGLFNMAGNVSEWTLDVYRPLTTETLIDVDQQDLNPFRGNVFKELVKDENGRPVFDSLGRAVYREVADSTVSDRYNYQKGDVRDYRDGDTEAITYDTYKHTLISDETRVIKGGSWADRLYWMAPGTRRFMDQDRSSRTVGFRCAMIRTGGSTSDGSGGNEFGQKLRTDYRYDR